MFIIALHELSHSNLKGTLFLRPLYSPLWQVAWAPLGEAFDDYGGLQSVRVT